MAAWGSAAVAAPAPAKRAAKPSPKAAPRRQAVAARRPRLLGSVAWIALLAALLAGIVALNVAVLQANVELDRMAERQAELTAANAALSAQLSSAGSAPQVAHAASRTLGLVPATPEQQTFVDLARALRK